MTPAVTTLLLTHAHRRITVELTEHTQVTDYHALNDITDQLRAAGILIAVDDAGAGYASLSHVLQLRPDIIKLDITLVRDIDTDPIRTALARALATFARETGAMLIAEGIETHAEHEKLRSLGVELGQGYYMARPGPYPAATSTLLCTNAGRTPGRQPRPAAMRSAAWGAAAASTWWIRSRSSSAVKGFWISSMSWSTPCSAPSRPWVYPDMKSTGSRGWL